MNQWIRRSILFIVTVVAVAGFSGCGAAKVEVPGNLAGKVYTQVTMWEEKGHISTINYSVGRKIPVNTEVKILSMSSKGIVFEDVRIPGIKLTLDNVEKYSQTPTVKLAHLYFAPTKVDLSKFTEKEQNFIKSFDGFYKAGISKEALIVARGYPPKHMTPSLKYDTWKYWRNRWVTKNVGFENNKLKTYNGQILK